MATFSGKILTRLTLALMTAGAVIVIASCQSRGTPPPEPTPAEGGFAGALGPTASGPKPVAPPVATVTATANAPPASACPSGMKEVTGTFCADVEHLCVEGWADISSPYKKYPGGAKGVTYCQKYLPGHATCIAPTKPMRFCIDQYEYPNVKGELPRVLVSWLDAEKLCKEQGKRLCNEDEWTLACEGPDRLPFGYGWDRDEAICNIKRKIPLPNRSLFAKPDSPEAQAELRRVDGREPIGSRAKCVSPYGVHDMTGNVDEWCRDPKGSMTHEPFTSVFKGGHMMGNIRNRCRPATTAHGPEFYDFVQGFRCCAAAQ